ncbi:MAG: glycosyltransferase [Chloroflexi bacterium]|nr:glycosyltransferase [Chloroflexota bacterium]
MDHRQPDQAHVLFLFSDTGAGHRSAAEAIIEALELEFPNRVTTEMVDIFKEYAPPPLDMAPEMYPPMSRHTDMWRFGYDLLNGRRRTRALTDFLWPYYRRASRRLIEEHPCDLIVSVHPLANGPILRAFGPNRPPFITVVTDLVSTHAFWYHRMVDLVLVPTEEARLRGIEDGVDPERIRVVGLPVAQRFCQPLGSRSELRSKLGWPEDLPVVLLVGGGEGMGPLDKTAYAIDTAGLKAALVVVTGRNRKMKSEMEAHCWSMPAYIYGFVREMPEFMRAADILVTKAGPGTISESFIAGLPIVLYSRVPGQEEGNVTYVVNEGAGVWAPQPEQVVAALRDWLRHPSHRERAAAACKRLARPNSAFDIARILGETLNLPKTNPESSSPELGL